MTNRKLALIVKDQDPLTMAASQTVRHACRRMWERRVGAVLVTDASQRLVGIFTGRDGVKLLAKGKTGRITLQDAMTANPVTVTPDQKAIDALRAMSDGGFRHVPVVHGGRIEGIVSRADFKGEELERLDEEEELAERIW